MCVCGLHPGGGPNSEAGGACSETPAQCLEGENSQQAQGNQKTMDLDKTKEKKFYDAKHPRDLPALIPGDPV